MTPAMHTADGAHARLLAAQHLRPDDVAWLRRGELPPRLAADVKGWQATNNALTLLSVAVVASVRDPISIRYIEVDCLERFA